MSILGFAPWEANKDTQVFLAEVIEVIYDQREYWPLTQRYWLYRLMAKKGWLKVDEYAPGKFPKEKRHLCTPGKNLNNILLRGRRSGLVPWEAISGSRGKKVEPMTSDSPESLADMLKWNIDNRQFDRQAGQDQRVVLWCETEGLIPLVEKTAHYYGATVLAGKGFDVLDNKYKFAKAVADKHDAIILHVGDLDKSGDELYRSLRADIDAFLDVMGGTMELRRIALTEQQAYDYNLSTTPAPDGLNKGNHGKYFTSKVECQLEALDAPDLIKIIEDGFENALDMELFQGQLDLEAEKKLETAELLVEMLTDY